MNDILIAIMKKMLIPLIILACLAIAAGVAYIVFTKTSDARDFDYGHAQRTLETGTPAKARVLKIRDTGGRTNRNPSVELFLEVQPATGPVFTATTRATISVVDVPRFQPGASIDVKYDPADHTSVAVIP